MHQESHIRAHQAPLKMKLQEFCPLFRLPGEIRNIIWRLLLRSFRCHYARAPLLFYICLDDKLHGRPKDEGVIHPKIMRTCQIIYAETLPILYSENIFELYRGRRRYTGSDSRAEVITYRSGVQSLPSSRWSTYHHTHYVPEHHVNARLVRRVAISSLVCDAYLSWHHVCRLLSPFRSITHIYIRIRPTAAVLGNYYWKNRKEASAIDVNMRVNNLTACPKPESTLEAESQFNGTPYRPASEFQYSDMPGPRNWMYALHSRSLNREQGVDGENFFSYSEDEWGPISVERWVIQPRIDKVDDWISNCAFF